MTDWGSVAEWVSGIGTMFGTIVVGLGLLWEVRQRRKADARVAAEQRDAEAADARRVLQHWRIADTCTVDVRNDGDGPITDVDLWLQVSATGSVLRPTGARPPPGLVGARDQVRIVLFFEPPNPYPEPEVDTLIEFTDARGLRWGTV